jgi:hypothetical protein
VNKPVKELALAVFTCMAATRLYPPCIGSFETLSRDKEKGRSIAPALKVPALERALIR